MSFCLGSTIRRGIFSTLVPSASTQSKSRRLVNSDRRRRRLSTIGSREKKSHWSGEAAGPWKPVAPTKVVEVRYDHFSDGRFRHGCTFLRMRPDKLPKDCLLEQVLQQTVTQDISAFIEAGLATAGTNRKLLLSRRNPCSTPGA